MARTGSRPGAQAIDAVSVMGLTSAQQQTVRGILATVLGDGHAWVFGSRATGRARPFSDLDVLVERRLTWAERAWLSDQFEDSQLPFKVDLVELDELQPGMAQRIFAERVALPLG